MRRIEDYFWRNGPVDKTLIMVVDKDDPENIVPVTTEKMAVQTGGIMGIVGRLFRKIQPYFWTQGAINKSVLMVVDKDDNSQIVPVTSDMLFGGAGGEVDLSAINETIAQINDKVDAIGVLPATDFSRFPKFRGVMYWPRKSPSMDMWRELDRETITWDDIATDLDQLKSLGINLVRVFTFFDHEFRVRGTNQGPTDGLGNFNQEYYDMLGTFIDMCWQREMYVVPTLFQELKYLRTTDDWSTLEADTIQHKEHINRIMPILNARKYAIPFYNLKNEPDGFGVWGNDALATRVLNWLYELKIHALAITDIPAVISSTTHDNAVYVFPGAPIGGRSILEISEILAFNSFRYADNGSWVGTTYRTQLEFTLKNNPYKKPVIFWECGYPANYDNQGEGVESIVPVGGEFDRPQGSSPQTPHTPGSQYKSVSEGIAWAEAYNTIGVMVWSAYDHEHPTLTTYRDNFGIIDKNGEPLPAAYALKEAFTNVFPSTHKRISLNQGTIAGEGRINGLNGWNAVDTSKNVVAGVYLGASGRWTSEKLPYRLPGIITLRLTPKEAFGNESAAIIIETPGRSLTLKYKDYGTKKWFLINTSDQAELARTVEPVGDLLPGVPFTISVDLRSTTVKIRYNNVEMELNNVVRYNAYQYYGQVTVVVVNSTGALEINDLWLKGNGPMTRNQNYFNNRQNFITTSNL